MAVLEKRIGIAMETMQVDIRAKPAPNTQPQVRMAGS